MSESSLYKIINQEIVGCYWQERSKDQKSYLPYVQHRLEFSLAVFEGFIMAMTQKEQLFADFFTRTYSNPTVLEMSISELRDWIELDLEKILLEAKATIQAAKQIEREKVSKLSSSEREKLLTTPSLSVSDSLTAVKKRKERMTKADKVYESMRGIMSDEDARRVAGLLPIDETKKPLPDFPILTDGSKTYVFAGTPEPLDTCGDCGKDYPANTKHECEAKLKRQQEARDKANKELESASKPSVDVAEIFDPGKLFK